MVLKKVRNRLIHLHRVPNITRKMLYRFLDHDHSLRLVYSMSSTEISHFLSISIQKANIVYNQIHSEHIRRLALKDCQNCHVITIFDKNYPQQMKHTYDAPLVLYALGNITLLNQQPSISVIGTRNPSHEGIPKLTTIVTPIIKEGWIIVSGLAYGIDSEAHLLTLRHQGHTIAVLGGGFNYIYPRENIELFHRIVKTGLVISEYPPDIPPRKYHFPERNRIISGISNATLVIEAKNKSGTLITVDQALEQGKEVYAVPGSPLLQQTEGCHQMIQDGAKLVIRAEDILEDWTTIV